MAWLGGGSKCLLAAGTQSHQKWWGSSVLPLLALGEGEKATAQLGLGACCWWGPDPVKSRGDQCLAFSGEGEKERG